MRLFRRRKKLSQERDEKLLSLLHKTKTEWMNTKDLYEKSVEPSDELRMELQLTKAKYIYLMKEAKQCNLRLRGRS
ncbi:YaaL family protein [Bacillus tianshenii]|nr:YaaL family protein [Bacillus tianshenii]